MFVTTDRKINYDNIYDLNRLGIDEINEGGISLTYGYEYTQKLINQVLMKK